MYTAGDLEVYICERYTATLSHDAAHQGYTVNAVTCRNGEEPDRRGAGRGGDPTAQRTSETGRGDQARPALEAAIRAVMSASSCLHTAAIRAVMSAHCLGESRIGANENTHSQATANAGTSAARQTARPRSASCLQVSAAPRTRRRARARLRQRVAFGDPES